jgi:hypothetical protein
VRPLQRIITIAVTLAIVLLPSPASAHPGSGIVVDRHGNVYFIRYGLNVIMKVTREGTASVLVGDGALRLPHHLVLGKDGALYVASDFDGIVWRVGDDGKITEHFNSNRLRGVGRVYSPFLVGFGGDPFTVDSAGNVYAMGRDLAWGIVRITPAAAVTPIAANTKFGDLHFSTMTWGPGAALYVSDRDRVWRIRNDSATAIVPGTELVRATGIAVDSAANVYVVDYDRRRVIRLAPDGSVNTPPALGRLRLRGPTGVTVAGGEVYVLDPTGDTKVWRIRGDAADRLFTSRDRATYVTTGLLIAVTLLFAVATLQRVPRGRGDWLAWILVSGGVVIGMYWVGRDAFVFSFARHAILALFLWGVIKSYRRITVFAAR